MSVAGTLQLQPTGLSKDAEISKTHKWPKKLPSRIPAKPLAAGEEQHAVVPRTLPGDSTALSLLFACERTRLYRAAFSILRNKEDAEDALQIGMLSAYTNLSSFEGRSSLATWVTRIVLNTALMNRRKQRARAQLSLDEAICDQPQTWADAAGRSST